MSGSASPSSSPTTSSTSSPRPTRPGKTPGTDLREGKRTLPVLHVLASTDPADARLQELLTGDLEDDARLAEALRPAARPPGDGAWPASTRTPWRARRRTCSRTLPDSDAKDALHALATGVVTRVG